MVLVRERTQKNWVNHLELMLSKKMRDGGLI
jgi:hypothetical protein